MEGKKLETRAIGAEEALDYLWILNISFIPDPSTVRKFGISIYE